MNGAWVLLIKISYKERLFVHQIAGVDTATHEANDDQGFVPLAKRSGMRFIQAFVAAARCFRWANLNDR